MNAKTLTRMPTKIIQSGRVPFHAVDDPAKMFGLLPEPPAGFWRSRLVIEWTGLGDAAWEQTTEEIEKSKEPRPAPTKQPPVVRAVRE